MNRLRPIVALYPGSFDPITLGHEDIARRALRVADKLIVAVAHSSTHDKRGLFGVDERVRLAQAVLGDEDRIEVRSFEGLLVDFARREGAGLVVRGLRAVSDFEYELQMAQMNQELWPEIETIFLVPEARHSFISSSLVREVASLGGDVSAFVSPAVLTQIGEKLGSN
ncbi:MAG: pantetheine-phosphate adenylyltransferase [Gemmatimonadota bacterium]|nr:pantetheine-phosphate adenylyltransferase [Gemmatimonadota bacterium]MDH3423049.1 pantetheine-phosphate adenylyltransferase [Gemmatimonadota bacterium]